MSKNGWCLEVVRGQEPGRVYPIGPGRCVLGNELKGEPGVDLSAHEGASPRRMAARQAEVDCSPQGLALRDLESPGGTFVNRQRLLAGQVRPLQPDDVIQLGSVQLKVSERPTTPPAPAARPAPSTAPSAPRHGPMPTPFVLAIGPTCRTWDDFLTVSAQSWSGLRDELTSGRLGEFLTTIGRDDLQPPAAGAKSADERLDAWLGRLPVTRDLEPDLEVHPSVLKVRAVAGGGLTRPRIAITNTGYRLLRSTVRVEPAETGWLRITPEFDRKPFTTAESTEVPLEVTIPESLARPLTAKLVIESNGGTRRVEVRLEAPQAVDLVPAGAIEGHAALAFAPGEMLMRFSPGTRIALGAISGAVVRALIAIGDRLPLVASGADAARPGLAGPALLLAIAGAVGGGMLAKRRGEPGDVPPAAFAGAFLGVLIAAIWVAVCRTIEPASIAASPLLACGFWAVLGVLKALVTLAIYPYRRAENEARS